MTFYWFAVFEQFTPIGVLQGEKDLDPGEQLAEEEPPAEVVQMVAEKWNRQGTINVSPGLDTGSIVKEIETGCKAGDVPDNALLVNIVILPNRLAG